MRPAGDGPLLRRGPEKVKVLSVHGKVGSEWLEGWSWGGRSARMVISVLSCLGCLHENSDQSESFLHFHLRKVEEVAQQ